ncbi:hypothetical protein [Nonomuraea sp. bgisy101]|uniref:hypothetical protein n=1 Tax=Nonomuraea sp. bgisy101 TaxID=3413784 RepID=UPI003D73DC72
MSWSSRSPAKKLGTDGKADIALITAGAIYLWEVKRNTVSVDGRNDLAIYIKALKALPKQQADARLRALAAHAQLRQGD